MAKLRLIYGLTIFASAFLLFQVEPLIGKLVLPWFGGGAGVWIVCLLFFQVALLLGYYYAHWLTHRFAAAHQAKIHAAILAVSLLALPIMPKDTWKPATPYHPALHILALLTVTVGLPLFLLSSTSPLLQAWYAREKPGSGPYHFYAVSNIGSMLALVSYPVVMEPWVTTSHQAVEWSWAYAAVALLCAAVGLSSSRRGAVPNDAESGPAPGWQVQALWLGLAACGSAMLLAVTHHLSRNIASVPLLWVIPLAIYLLTFILCFGGRRWYRRDLYLRLAGVALGAMAYALSPSFEVLPIKVAIPLYCACLFVCCMFCHGELAGLKPHPAHLTSFYLMVSLGGAIGAIFVALVAPAVFSGDYELRIVVGGCAALVLVVLHRDPASPFYRARRQPGWLLTLGLGLTIMASLAVTGVEEARSARLMVRNFYGVLRVVDRVAPNVVVMKGNDAPRRDPDSHYLKLMNGTIDHGLQFTSPARRRQPTTYYGPNSGIGITLRAAGAGTPLNVGVIGLGVGTVAAYGRPGDRYTFYEINPLVVQLARQDFTYLRDSPAKVDIVLGDARLSLEHEPPQHFDVLAVDAFSGDSIPIHLLTQEAFQLYFRHLKPEGVLAVHISNQYLNLVPVVAGAAAGQNKEAVIINNPPDAPQGISAATWVLLGDRAGFFAQAEIEKTGGAITRATPQLRWTDDYSSLLKVLM